MASTPQLIEVYSTADMERMTETLRSSMMHVADYLENQSAAMKVRIENTLIDEGLDGARATIAGMAFGSSAASAAAKIARPASQASEHLEAASRYISALNRAWHVHLVTPVEAARRARAQGSGRRKMNV